MPTFPKIPVPSFGGGSYFSPSPASVGSGAAREGGVGQVLASLQTMPAMPSPAAPLASGGGGGGSQGPSFGAGLSYGGGVDVNQYNPFAGIDFSSIQPGVTINVAGGISTSAEIGRSVVDALTQYSQVYGPLNLAIR